MLVPRADFFLSESSTESDSHPFSTLRSGWYRYALPGKDKNLSGQPGTIRAEPTVSYFFLAEPGSPPQPSFLIRHHSSRSDPSVFQSYATALARILNILAQIRLRRPAADISMKWLSEG